MYSIVPTRRRRFLWAAWWTAAPVARPYRKPDASNGGALTREEAREQAERAAGRTLTETDAHWAGAWKRVLDGKSPWPNAQSPRAPGSPATPRVAPRIAPIAIGSRAWAHRVLEIGTAATPDELKRAFRAAALRTHPDRGGAQAEFIEAKRAYDVAVKPAKKKKPSGKRRARSR